MCSRKPLEWCGRNDDNVQDLRLRKMPVRVRLLRPSSLAPRLAHRVASTIGPEPVRYSVRRNIRTCAWKVNYAKSGWSSLATRALRPAEEALHVVTHGDMFLFGAWIATRETLVRIVSPFWVSLAAGRTKQLNDCDYSAIL